MAKSQKWQNFWRGNCRARPPKKGLAYRAPSSRPCERTLLEIAHFFDKQQLLLLWWRLVGRMKGINSTKGGQYIIAALRQLPPRRPTRWPVNRPIRRHQPSHFVTPFSTCRTLRTDDSTKSDGPIVPSDKGSATKSTNASQSTAAEKNQNVKSGDLIGPDELTEELESLIIQEMEAAESGLEDVKQGLSKYLPPEQIQELKETTLDMLRKEPGSIKQIARERPLTLQLLFQEDNELREGIARDHPDLVEQITNLDPQSVDLALLEYVSDPPSEDLTEFERKLRDPAYIELLREEERKIQEEEEEEVEEENSSSGQSLRIVPASPSYFTGQPDFTDGLLELRTLLRQYEILPTVEPIHAPRVAWKKYAQYKVDINEPVRAAKYHKIIEVLQRLNRIHPALIPEEVVATMQKYKRDINPHDNKPNPVFIDEHGRALGIGRRKTSSAKVWVVEGTGEVLINGKTLPQMFSRLHDRESAVWALKATQRIDKYNVFALVTGGGVTGQAEAITLAIAKALMVHEPALKPALRRGTLFPKIYALTLLFGYFLFDFIFAAFPPLPSLRARPCFLPVHGGPLPRIYTLQQRWSLAWICILLFVVVSTTQSKYFVANAESAGCVTRDPRKVERKKAGKVKARKMPAWVKR